MGNKKTVIIILAVLVVLLAGACVLYPMLSESVSPNQITAEQEMQPQTEAEKPLAPDFTVYDADGNEVKLSDYFGKPIVLNFWASWCGPCQMEMPDFHEKYLELSEQVTFLMVNMTTGRETKESAQEFIEKNAFAFPVFFDTESSAASAYGAYSLPTTYFIDADGYAVTYAVGAIDAETLQLGIDMILPA